MPIVDYSPVPLNKFKRKHEDGDVPINFANCVITLQFNVGKEYDYPQPKYSVHVKGEKDVTLVIEEELSGILLVCLDRDIMSEYMMSTSDLSLEFVTPDGNKSMSTFDKSLYGFKTPELKFKFGEKDTFMLMYTNVFGCALVLNITVICIGADV